MRSGSLEIPRHTLWVNGLIHLVNSPSLPPWENPFSNVTFDWSHMSDGPDNYTNFQFHLLHAHTSTEPEINYAINLKETINVVTFDTLCLCGMLFGDQTF